MQKSLFRTLALAVTLIMLFTFTGCGILTSISGGNVNSRMKPAKSDETVVYDSMNESYDAFKLEITLLEVVRGGTALKMAKQADNYNETPPEGKDYLIAKFRVNALRSKNDEPIDVHYMFDIVKSDGSVYDNARAYITGINELTTMYQGAEQEGYIFFTVDKSEQDLLIAFPSYSKSQIWFSAAPTSTRNDDYNPSGDLNRLGSQNNPARLGQTANYNGIDLTHYTFNIDVAITELSRGQKAADIVANADKYNDEPPYGKEYLIAKIRLDAISSRDNGPIDVSKYDFKLFSSNGIEYTQNAYVSGFNDNISQMYPNSSQYADLIFLLDENDLNPSIIFLNDSQMPVWFSASQSNRESSSIKTPEPVNTGISAVISDSSGLSSNWEDLEFIFDGRKYSLPASYKSFETNGWSFNLKDYGHPDGYIVNKGDRVIGTIKLKNSKYTSTYDFTTYIGFANNDNKSKDILDCDIYDFDFSVSNLDKSYPEMIVAGGLTIGSSFEQILSILGNNCDIYENGSYKSITYETSDYKKELCFTLDNGKVERIELKCY